MLKVSKDSWHYRWAYNSWGAQLWKWGDITSMHPKENPGNLCTYIRQLIKPCFSLGIVGFFVLGWLTTTVCWLFGIPVLPELPEGYTPTGWEMFWRVMQLVGAGMWIVIGLVGGLAACILGGMWIHEEWYTPWKDNRKQMIADGVIPEPQPGLLRQYLTALHDKTCPLLEIEKDEEEQA